MARPALALLLHPYKNGLLPKSRLRELLSDFATRLIDIALGHPNLRIHLVLPGYLLEHTDPMLLSQLNEIQKRDCLEWLSPGYTEPFLSFSQLWLSGANIKHNMQIFEEHVGTRPAGFVPAFSNWEPSCIEMLRKSGVHYAVLSRTLLPRNFQHCCGYWTTEHGGACVPVFPSHNMHHFSAPANIGDWIDRTMSEDRNQGSGTQLVVLDYLVPLERQKKIDPFQWIRSFVSSLDRLLLKYQMVLLREFLCLAGPMGLQYIPASLVFKREDESDVIPLFSNYLHTFDTVGIMQRKMMDIADTIQERNQNRETMALTKQLFFVQDINRYLPHVSSGFPDLTDRFRTFGRMIELERKILEEDRIHGGQIRIADLLRNGSKSAVMSNRSLKVYVDYRSGGQVFELDYRDRNVNLMSAHTSERHELPGILVPGESRTSFVDHFIDPGCQRVDFMSGSAKQHGDFVTGAFDCKVKKTAAAVRAALTRQGSLMLKGKNCPLNMEKVFGIEQDKPQLTFVYQLANHSLATYDFRFAVELNFALPGAPGNKAYVVHGADKLGNLTWDRFSIDQTTGWSIEDSVMGVRVAFVTQKPVDVWVFPVVGQQGEARPYQGTTLVVSTPVSLASSAVWSLMGKIVCSRIRTKGRPVDVV